MLEENRASSKVYESLLQAQDDMGLGFFVHEAGRLSYANESCSRISGYSLEELGAMPSVYSLVVPEQRDLLLERLRRRRQGRHGQQVVEHYESAIVRKDGQRIDVELVVKPLRDGDERQAVLLRDITDRKNTEKAIKESEERFRSAFENASTGVALVGLDRRYLKVNRALCALLGYEEEELLTRVSSEITYPEDLRKGEERTEQLLSGDAEASSLEKRYIRKDGSVVWAISDVSLVRDAEGNPSHFVSQFQDITQLKRVEEALREAETRYRTLVETIPAVTYIQEIHDTSTTVYVSPQMKDVLGYTPEECTSDPDHWIKVLHPEDKERVLAEDERTNATGEPFSMEYRQIAKDGRVVWLRDDARVVRDEEGNPAYWLGVQVDITKRKEAEALLRESEKRFRSVVQNSSEIVNIVDIDGTVKYSSPALERVLGYCPERFVGENVLDYVHPDDLPDVVEKTEEALREPGVARNRVEYRFRHRDGSWRHMEALGTYLLDDPSVQGVLVTSRDVTQRKEAERKRHEAEARFRTLVEQVPAIIYAEELSRNGKVLTYMSPQYEALLGYSWEPGVSHPEQWLDRIHPDDRDRVLAEDARTDETLEPFMVEYRMFTHDGRILRMRDEAVIVRDDNGEPLFWQGIMFDITEKMRTDEALKKANSALPRHDEGRGRKGPQAENVSKI